MSLGSENATMWKQEHWIGGRQFDWISDCILDNQVALGNSLGLSFLICKGRIIIFIPHSCWENEITWCTWKQLPHEPIGELQTLNCLICLCIIKKYFGVFFYEIYYLLDLWVDHGILIYHYQNFRCLVFFFQSSVISDRNQASKCYRPQEMLDASNF